MKEKVLAILSCKKSDSDKFNELFALYRSLPGKSDSLVKHFNTRGFSQETFEDLSYQTKKLLSISDLEAASYKSKPCHDCGGGKAKPEEFRVIARQKIKQHSTGMETSLKIDEVKIKDPRPIVPRMEQKIREMELKKKEFEQRVNDYYKKQ